MRNGRATKNPPNRSGTETAVSLLADSYIHPKVKLILSEQKRRSIKPSHSAESLSAYHSNLDNLKKLDGLSRYETKFYREFVLPDIFDLEFFKNSGLSVVNQANLLVLVSFIYNAQKDKELSRINHTKLVYAEINRAAFSSCLTGFDDKKTVKNFLEKLESIQLLQIDRSFLPGVKSFGYRIGAALTGAKWEERDFATTLNELVRPQDLRKSPRFAASYNLWDRTQLYYTWEGFHTLEQQTLTKTIKHHLLSLRLPVTSDFALLLDECARTKAAKNKKIGKGQSYPELKENYQRSVDSINAGNHYISYDPVTGRQFSRVVNLKSQLRAELRYEGEKLASCDFVSCQPALFACFYSDEPADQEEKRKFIHVIVEQ